MSMQKCSEDDDLDLSSLNEIFENITAGSQHAETLDQSAKKSKTVSRFVKNSGIVPYETSSDSSCESDSVDIENDSPPPSPVFTIPQ